MTEPGDNNIVPFDQDEREMLAVSGFNFTEEGIARFAEAEFAVLIARVRPGPGREFFVTVNLPNGIVLGFSARNIELDVTDERKALDALALRCRQN